MPRVEGTEGWTSDQVGGPRRYSIIGLDLTRPRLASVFAKPKPKPKPASRPLRLVDNCISVNARKLDGEGAYRKLVQGGNEVRLSADRRALVVKGPGRQTAARYLVDQKGPEIRAYLAGETFYCTVSKHDPPVVATHAVLGGAGCCDACWTSA